MINCPRGIIAAHLTTGGIDLEMDSMHELNIQSAFSHYREGRLSEAEALYRQVLAVEPLHSHALCMLGMLLMDNARVTDAEAIFLRLLDFEADHPLALHNLGRLLQSRGHDLDAVVLLRRAATGKPDLAPIHNDLAVSLHRMGQFDEAMIALDRALAIDPCFGMAHDNRGVVLYDCRRFGEALDAHLKALEYTPDDAALKRMSILLHISHAACETADLKLAEHACRAMLEMDADNADAIEQLARVMYRLRRDDDALSLLNQLARTQGLGKKEGAERPEATILVLGGAGASHVPTRYLFDPALFARVTLVMVSPDQTDAPLGGVSWDALLCADLIFNTMGEVERNGGQFGAVNMLVARLAKPLLNSPDQVSRTGRDQAHALFGDIPGLLVPQVRWMLRDEPIGAFTDPFLIRPGGTHGGDGLALIRTHAELTEYLAKTPCERFLLTDFHDFKGLRGCYRKYRFIFVDRKPYPYHLAIAGNWLVHYWRTDMGRVDWKRQEEEDFLTDWRQVFGYRAAAAIEQVAQRMNLDYGGLDCSILPNGEVLFFEANACMLVHDTEAALPCKQRAVADIRDAVTFMVRSTIHGHAVESAR